MNTWVKFRDWKSFRLSPPSSEQDTLDKKIHERGVSLWCPMAAWWSSAWWWTVIRLVVAGYTSQQLLLWRRSPVVMHKFLYVYPMPPRRAPSATLFMRLVAGCLFKLRTPSGPINRIATSEISDMNKEAHDATRGHRSSGHLWFRWPKKKHTGGVPFISIHRRERELIKSPWVTRDAASLDIDSRVHLRDAHQ